jgi:LmbE family N-acetylglucosaminyl deacetylase
VFAPHQDDETLGCGGTIILKRQAGTPVTVVFMTDGSTSHKRFMDEGELRRLRKAEALEAAEVLGVSSQGVHFLDFPDGRLARFHEAAVSQVLALLNRQQPDEVFVPYHRDGTPDHEATYRIVVEAMRKSALTLHLHEYPVWLWNQWPWVSLNLACSREAARAVWRAIRSGFGLAFFREFRSGVLVSEVLARKREALARHRSQTSVLKPGVGWPTLSDVSHGQFLSCFFQKYELYVSADPRRVRL